MPELLRGSAAEQRLATASFRSRWRALSAACPWSTVYQEAAFVTAWYTTYRDAYEPIVIVEADATGALRGLLCLAMDRASGQLVSCGTSQAEYDAWLALPGDQQAFIEGAWATLRTAYPHGRIDFLFLPPGAPLTFSDAWTGRCLLRPFSRPLFATTPEASEAQASLRKKGNKSKLNQLKRVGELSFTRVTDAAAFDARQSTLNGAPPFGEDPRRRDFFRAMFREGILHVTAMRVGGILVAAHIGHINRGQVVLGLIAHSPFFAKYSVGKFQVLLLAVELQREGFEAFDLTPAGEYKERFATHSDTAHVLTVFLSPIDARRYRVQRALIDAGKRYLSTDDVKAALTRVRHVVRRMRPVDALRLTGSALLTLVRPTRETRVYLQDAASAMARPAPTSLRRDAIEDLLRYEPTEPAQAMYGEFLRTALDRLADGWHVYTRVEDGRLIQWGWMAGPGVDVRGLGALGDLPAGTAHLADFYTHAAHRGRGLFGRALLQLAAEAGRLPGVTHVAIAAPRAHARAIERAGFVYDRSIFIKRRLWRSPRSAAPVPAGGAEHAAAEAAAADAGSTSRP